MVSLPKNISLIQWKNEHGRVVKYRVRIKTKTFVADKLFDSLAEAKDFVANSKSAAGRKNLKEKSQQELDYEDFFKSPALEYYMVKYLATNFEDNKDDYLYHKKVISIRSFFKTLRDTECVIQNHMLDGAAGLAEGLRNVSKPLGKIKVEELSYITINSYIKVRLSLNKKISTVKKELEILFQFLEDLKHLSPAAGRKLNISELKGYDPKPFRKAAKLEHQQTVTFTRFSDDTKDKIFNAMCWCPNIEVFEIFLLATYTSMRRSEVLQLRWEQLRQTHIKLKHTKSGKPRDVVLTQDAKNLLKIIAEGRRQEGKVFSISFTGFEKWWQRLQEKFEFKDVNFHSIRKESISTFIDNVEIKSSITLAKLLGISNIDKFESQFLKKDDEDLTTQQGVLKHAGHEKAQTTSDHYYRLKLPEN